MPRRKIPTKAELIQLQKLYKTDDKIAERLGNVTPQLVAYWRRKKNVPKHSYPKFSWEDIRDLWERYGDDYRCGLELGISKAAFYNWRRRYDLKEKPAFLKLEQLELKLGGPNEIMRISRYGCQTIAQKILADRAGMEKVENGQEVAVEPDLAMSPINASDVIGEFTKKGLNFVWNPNRIVVPLDCLPSAKTKSKAESRQIIREFTRKQNIKYFYDFGEGACHQIIVEKGHILPGQLAFGTDRYLSSYGCLGAFGMEIGLTDMVNLWANGRLEVTVPSTVKININGKMRPGVYVRDIVHFIAKKLGIKGLANKAVEFNGVAVSQMSISERFTLCGLMREAGAVAAIVPYDSTTRRYMMRRTKMPYRPALADKDAIYEDTYEFNVDNLSPQIARPHSFDNVVPVYEAEGQPVERIFIGGNPNGRFDDLRIVAGILKGRKINSGVRLYINPCSQSVFLEALKKGLIRALVESGGVVMCPGSISSQSDNQGILASGEACLATTSSNTRGALGSTEANIFLASPATAAASALKGVVTDPTNYIK
jgi:homoaconitate hydratase family protein